MNILLCHERFIFRYGVDRVLRILGDHFARAGHYVRYMGIRFDEDFLESHRDVITTIPETTPYSDLDISTSNWLIQNWKQIFQPATWPDVVVTAGWPFHSAIPVFKNHGCRVIFNDHGVVPSSTYPDPERAILEQISILRKRYISFSDTVIAVSEFVRDSQSRRDIGTSGPRCIAIHNGADHIAPSLGAGVHVLNSPAPSLDLAVTDSPSNGGRILLLGRWEPRSYKNSELAIQLAKELSVRGHFAQIYVLANADEIDLAPELARIIIPIGYPNDTELSALMASCSCGLSTSTWEGFNLPLAEMQYLGRPVFALARGAHHEVVVSPTFLARNDTDLISKILNFFDNPTPYIEEFKSLSEAHQKRFLWGSIAQLYLKEFAEQDTQPHPAQAVIIDTTNACRDDGNSGVIRVTRALCRELQRLCDPIYVCWDRGTSSYRYPTEAEYNRLSSFGGPLISPYHRRSQGVAGNSVAAFLPPLEPGGWLLLPETTIEKDGNLIRQWASANQLQVASIFHDSIPVERPDLVKDPLMLENHADYMRGLTKVDLVLPNSNFSKFCFEHFCRQQMLDCPSVRTAELPGEFFPRRRPRKALTPGSAEPRSIRILCVSTLEPRKNHRRLLAAFRDAAHNLNNVDFSLTLIGNRYSGSDDIVELVEEFKKEDPRINWLGIVDDNQLAFNYEETTFTAYCSEIEGFGMPILESLWFGKPCLCHNRGVMADLAIGGGCYTVDVTNHQALTEALVRLSTDAPLLKALSDQAAARSIKTWREWAAEVYSNLSLSA